MSDKPTMVPVNDAAEVASAERDGACDLLAFNRGGQWWAIKADLERWRKWQADSSDEQRT
jgi:hypothetical protein